MLNWLIFHRFQDFFAELRQLAKLFTTNKYSYYLISVLLQCALVIIQKFTYFDLISASQAILARHSMEVFSCFQTSTDLAAFITDLFPVISIAIGPDQLAIFAVTKSLQTKHRAPF